MTIEPLELKLTLTELLALSINLKVLELRVAEETGSLKTAMTTVFTALLLELSAGLIERTLGGVVSVAVSLSVLVELSDELSLEAETVVNFQVLS